MVESPRDAQELLGDGCVHYLDCDGFMNCGGFWDQYIHIHDKTVYFRCTIYTNYTRIKLGVFNENKQKRWCFNKT